MEKRMTDLRDSLAQVPALLDSVLAVMPPVPLGVDPPSFVVTPVHAAEMHNRFSRLASALLAMMEERDER